MKRDFEGLVDRACARWIAWVDRRPGLVAALLGALTLALGIYAANTLGVNADPDALIRADLPWRQAEDRFRETFHTFDEAILVVIDADSASAAGRAADALAAELAKRSDLYNKVGVPGGGPFFQRNALLFLDLPELERLSDRLAAVQPFLGELARDQSVVGISKLLSQALVVRRGGVDVGLDLAGALDRVSVAAEAAGAARAAPDPWGDALIGGSMSEDARHRVVELEPRHDYGALMSAGPAIQAVRDSAAALALDSEHGVRVRVTGDTPLNFDEQIVIQRQGMIVGVVSFVLFSAIVSLALRSPRVVLALVGSVLASVLWTNAFAAFAVGHLNQVSAAFNVLIIGLGGEFGIHVCMRYMELVAEGRSRADALVEMGHSMGSSLVSSAGTTAIGFYVFLPTDYRGVAELGYIAGTGVLLSLLSSLTVLPALLSLGAPEQPKAAAPSLPWAAKLQHLPLRFAAPIRWTSAAVALGAAFLLPRASFDHNPVNLRDPNTESVQAFDDLLSRSHSTPWTADVVAADLPDAEALAERVRALPGVEAAITLADYVPKDQPEKRVILEEAALFVPPLAEPAPPPNAATQRAALAALDDELKRSEDTPGALGASARRLRGALAAVLARSSDDTPEANQVLALLGTNVVGSLPEQLNDLRIALAPTPVTQGDLPPELRDQMLAPDGRARVQIRPRADLSDSVALEAFVDSIREVAPDATGAAVSLVEWGRVTSGAMQQALLAGLLTTALFLYLLWRRLWDTVLAFFPLALAAMVTCALMVLTGLRFNFANVIVLPMLLGMGIDNGIHLVHRHRTSPEEVDVLSTSTARAVFFSAVTTVLSFGSLAFAPHRGMAALGQVLTIGVAATLICYVVVLPAVLEWDDRRMRVRAAASAPPPGA